MSHTESIEKKNLRKGHKDNGKWGNQNGALVEAGKWLCPDAVGEIKMGLSDGYKSDQTTMHPELFKSDGQMNRQR